MFKLFIQNRDKKDFRENGQERLERLLKLFYR